MISNCDEKRCEALLTDTSVGSTGGGHSSGVSSLVDGGADPVDSGISSNRLVRRVDQNDLVELVDSVLIMKRCQSKKGKSNESETNLVDPVRVENSESSTSSRNSFLGGRSERSLELEVVDTLVRGFTESSSLGNRSFSVSSSDSDSVDHEALLGLARESRESATELETRIVCCCAPKVSLPSWNESK